MSLTAQQAAVFGFIFPSHRGWITPSTMAHIAQDAALVTMPNAAVPAELAAYIDPRVIDILTAPLKAREVFTEVKKGDWTTPYAKFRVDEITGSTEAYSDYGQSSMSGTNSNWLTRENYLFQTMIKYGDLETEVSAVAKINLASKKQQAAARVIDIDSNRFYLRGVAGKKIFGLLNDPSLAAPMAPLPTGTGNSPLWNNKTTKQRYEDILALFQSLVTASQGYVDKDTKLKLVMSPQLAVDLASATDFNISVQDMLDKYFKNLTIITVPEMHNATTGETMMIIADEVQGMQTGELGFSEKVRAHRVIPDVSSMRQKWSSGTYGALIYLPFAIQQMRGM
ncbi:MAG: DUF2184 domain-containing protein [Desulfovibrionaceae bacterium]